MEAQLISKIYVFCRPGERKKLREGLLIAAPKLTQLEEKHWDYSKDPAVMHEFHSYDLVVYEDGHGPTASTVLEAVFADDTTVIQVLSNDLYIAYRKGYTEGESVYPYSPRESEKTFVRTKFKLNAWDGTGWDDGPL